MQVIRTYPQDSLVEWENARSLGGAIVLMMLIMIQSADNSSEGRPGSIRRQLSAILLNRDIATSEDFQPALAIKKAQEIMRVPLIDSSSIID